MLEVSNNRTVLDIIKIVLPNGTRGQPSGWDLVCEWPPDLFAVIATITEQSGLYAEDAFTSYWARNFVGTEGFIEKITRAGSDWGRRGKPPRLVANLWAEVIRNKDARVVDSGPEALSWKKAVFQLLGIADEACAGVGFLLERDAKSGTGKKPSKSLNTNAAYIFFMDYVAWVDKADRSGAVTGGDVLPYLPHSMCVRVPPTVLCVQPKTCTPSAGCTMRSLTHHLALLPPIGIVTTHWRIAAKSEKDLGAFNILVVPFPYSVPGTSFSASTGCFPGNLNDRSFMLNPDIWMRGASPREIATFLQELMKQTEAELEPVHAIVLPETALRLECADAVATILAKESGLDLFVTGVVAGEGGETRNSAAIYRFTGDEVIGRSYQSKHHRWCLNGDQIRRYHLGHVLDPQQKWWEQIDVSHRNCYIHLFRARATFSVLVCEDLARYDPVLTVMNAIGPNLVIALLMDGPQLEQRWPGRYATALADDPGSSVLTVTSLGMVARSAMPGEPQNREIALWKEPDGRAQALKLPKGDHALLLTLTSKMFEQFTLDGRTDCGETVHFGLGAAHGVRHPAPPKWLGTVP